MSNEELTTEMVREGYRGLAANIEKAVDSINHVKDAYTQSRTGNWIDKYAKYDLIIFDWDDTLCVHWTGTPLPRRVEYIKRLSDAGKKFGVATNQAGIHHGYTTQKRVKLLIAQGCRDLGMLQGNDRIWVCICWAKEDSNDPNRKPNPGMLLHIMEELNVAPDKTLFVGDRDTDEQAAAAAKIDFERAWEFFEDEELTI